MRVEFFPSKLSGTIKAPCSKSYAHRLLIAGALSKNECVISNVDFNNDINETINVLRKLGKEIIIKDNEVILKGELTKQDNIEFEVLESGSTLRFLIPVAMVFSSNIKINCSPQLIKRGIGVYVDAFSSKGIDIKVNETSIEIKGKLTSGDYVIPGNISSQYVTGLLYALSLLDETSHLKVLKPVESEDYINITLDVLKHAKVNILNNDYVYEIAPKAFILPNSEVEGDYSNAAFIYGLNYTLSTNIDVIGLNKESKQGDKVYEHMFKELSLGYKEFDISNCIDLGPVLFAFASLCEGGKFTGTKRLAIKESNRALAMQEELDKCGVHIEVGEDYVSVPKGNFHSPDKELDSHNDHRIAMSMAMVLIKYGGVINNFEAVNKSYPKYLDDIKKLGGRFKIYE
ncbi:MAG: 3-phosphoshikimate 1-carboxyvinyltransferase [Bacilli bacterium]|nr:3-phosphoshikimate 1-carboxyvinyltransferase [Bacilli bacterium]